MAGHDRRRPIAVPAMQLGEQIQPRARLQPDIDQQNARRKIVQFVEQILRGGKRPGMHAVRVQQHHERGADTTIVIDDIYLRL